MVPVCQTFTCAFSKEENKHQTQVIAKLRLVFNPHEFFLHILSI